jgi:hypothetical protein
MITAADSLTGKDLINIEDVTARIAHLEAHDCHRPPEGPGDWCSDYECATCDESTGDELAALRDLEEAMRPANEYSERASAIRDSYMATFVRQEADDIVGELGHIDSYIKWDELTADRQGEMTETTFLGTTYYITS